MESYKFLKMLRNGTGVIDTGYWLPFVMRKRKYCVAPLLEVVENRLMTEANNRIYSVSRGLT